MDQSLMALAEMLKRTQGQRAAQNNQQPMHSPMHIGMPSAAVPPAYQAPGSMLPPMADYMRKQQTPPAQPGGTVDGTPVTGDPHDMALQKALNLAAPPPTAPVIAPGNQAEPVVPPMPPPTQIGPNSPSFWERLNMANKAQQVPNYGMAMGQPLQNV